MKKLKLIALGLVPCLLVINIDSACAFDLEDIAGDLQQEITSGIDLNTDLSIDGMSNQLNSQIDEAAASGKTELANLLKDRLSSLGVIGDIVNGDLDLEKIADVLGLDGYIDIVKLATDPEYQQQILPELVGTDRVAAAVTQVVTQAKIAKDTDTSLFDRRTEEESMVSQLGDQLSSIQGTDLGEPGESTYDVVIQSLNENRENASTSNVIGGEQLKVLGIIAERQKIQIDAQNTNNQLALKQVENIVQTQKHRDRSSELMAEKNRRTSFGMAGFGKNIIETEAND